MSGMARLDPTMPGNVATFIACSSEESLRICSISGALAYTTTSVRIPRFSSRAMRWRKGSICSICISDVQINCGNPGAVALFDSQLMVRDGLHNQARPVPFRIPRFAGRNGVNPLVRQFDAKLPQRDALPVVPIQDLVQPIDHQSIAIAALGGDAILFARLGRLGVPRDREHRDCGVGEQLLERAAEGAKPDVRRMFQNLEHAP